MYIYILYMYIHIIYTCIYIYTYPSPTNNVWHLTGISIYHNHHQRSSREIQVKNIDHNHRWNFTAFEVSEVAGISPMVSKRLLVLKSVVLRQETNHKYQQQSSMPQSSIIYVYIYIYHLSMVCMDLYGVCIQFITIDDISS